VLLVVVVAVVMVVAVVVLVIVDPPPTVLLVVVVAPPARPQPATQAGKSALQAAFALARPLRAAVLGYFRYRGRGCAQDVALTLGLGVDLVADLLDDLEAADMADDGVLGGSR